MMNLLYKLLKFWAEAETEVGRKKKIRLIFVGFYQSFEYILVVIYGHATHGPAAQPAARPFGTAHGPHDTALTVPVSARHEGQCVSWAAGQAHDTARARHGQGRGTVAGTVPAPRCVAYRHGSCSGGRPSALRCPLLLVPSSRQEPRTPTHLLLVGMW
jgi:hypothetical protein